MATRAYQSASSFVRVEGSKIRLAFDQFTGTPTCATPSNMTLEHTYPTSGGTGSATKTTTCRWVDIDNTTNPMTAVCHMDDDVFTSATTPDSVKVNVPLGWLASASDQSAAVVSTPLTNSSQVFYPKAVAGWDEIPHRVYGTSGLPLIWDVFVFHRYGYPGSPYGDCAVTVTVADASGHAKALTGARYGKTSDRADEGFPLYSVVRASTTALALIAAGVLDTFDGRIKYQITPPRGDAASVRTTIVYANDHFYFTNTLGQVKPSLEEMRVTLNHAGTLDVAPRYAVVDPVNGSDTTGVVSTSLAAARLAPCLTIYGAKQKYSVATINRATIILLAGYHRWGPTPTSQVVPSASEITMDNSGWIYVQADSTLTPDQVFITNAAFTVFDATPNATDTLAVQAGQVVMSRAAVSHTYTFAAYPTVAQLTAAIAADFPTLSFTVYRNIPSTILAITSVSLVEGFREYFREVVSTTGIRQMYQWVEGVTILDMVFNSNSGGSTPRHFVTQSCKVRAETSRQSNTNQIPVTDNVMRGGIWGRSLDFSDINKCSSGWVMQNDCTFTRIGGDCGKQLSIGVNWIGHQVKKNPADAVHPDHFQWSPANLGDPTIECVIGMNLNMVDDCKGQPYLFNMATGMNYDGVAWVNNQWNSDQIHQSAGNQNNILIWHCTGIDTFSAASWLFRGTTGSGGAPSTYTNVSIRNCVGERVRFTGQNNANTLGGTMPSVWAAFGNCLFTETFVDSSLATIPISRYAAAGLTTGGVIENMFIDPNADLHPTAPALLNRLASGDLVMPYDAEGTVISIGGAIGALQVAGGPDPPPPPSTARPAARAAQFFGATA